MSEFLDEEFTFQRDFPHQSAEMRRARLARLSEDDPLGRYDGHAGDLVPGYADSPDGLADAADQARMDAQ